MEMKFINLESGIETHIHNSGLSTQTISSFLADNIQHFFPLLFTIQKLYIFRSMNTFTNFVQLFGCMHRPYHIPLKQ